MTQTVRRVVAGAAVALAATGAAAAPAQAALAPLRWHLVLQRHAGATGNFTAVVAIGKTGGWAFNAAGPSAWRRNGTRWTKVDFPGKPGERVVAAGASSASDVWAFTAGGARSRVLRWDGSTWSRVHSFSKQIGGAIVISRTNVWVFGAPAPHGQRLGAWHWDGQTWTHPATGLGLQGGSAVSASSIWAFNGTDVSHWNGSAWTATSVAAQLPAKTALNNPGITAIYAQSAKSVWAIGNGNQQDEGGPLAILHFNGSSWRRVATDKAASFPGFGSLDQVAPDGNGGLWIPMPGSGSQPGHLVHYSGGKLTGATLPASASKINVVSISHIPGTAQELAGGFTHAANNPGANVVAVVLQLKR